MKDLYLVICKCISKYFRRERERERWKERAKDNIAFIQFVFRFSLTSSLQVWV